MNGDDKYQIEQIIEATLNSLLEQEVEKHTNAATYRRTNACKGVSVRSLHTCNLQTTAFRSPYATAD